VSDQERNNQQQDVTPSDYILANFRSSDRIAVLARNARHGKIIQRIASAENVAGTSFQDWMHYKNDKEAFDIYVGMNALKPSAFSRTKDDVQDIRHLYVDLDHYGSASLTAILRSTQVPSPNYVLATSPDKYQAIWKVEGIELTQAEALLHAMAREFGGDHAATDAARVLRVPGFMNKKYDQDFLVSARFQTDRVYHFREFKLRTESADFDYRRPRRSPQNLKTSEPRSITQSERDWAHVKSSLAAGADPEELIVQLARSRAADKSDPQYYARLTVTKALADLRAHVTTYAESESHRNTDH
jgi:RepB DNA-primase from phage plasmid